MRKPSTALIHQLCAQLAVERQFIMVCLEESAIEIRRTKGRLTLANGTALRLRRLQRICLTFDVDVHAALLLMRE